MSFITESFKNLKTVGTLTRSSKFLAKSMVKHVDFSKAKTIVELGAGDGPITRYILKGMRNDAKLMVFEVNSNFCKKLREIKDERLIVIEDSAEKLDYYISENSFGEIDYFISAIPFVVIPENIAKGIVGSCMSALTSGGKFIQVHYSLLTRKMYRSIFGNVVVKFVPFNLPPAFVMVSIKMMI